MSETTVGYRPDIDGLRAIAVLSVLLFHADVPLMTGGFAGVDIFFVISGYLITGIITGELEQGRFSIARFYERRARRILPALFVVMAACLPLAWWLFLPAEMRDFSRSVLGVTTFTSNIYFWMTSDYFHQGQGAGVLLHTWSLSVEEQYYLLYPPIIAFVWKQGRLALTGSLLAIFAASLGVSWWSATNAPMFGFYWLPSRAWELALSALAQVATRSVGSGWPTPRMAGAAAATGLAMIFAAFVLLGPATPYPGLMALLPTVGTAAVLVFGRSGRVARLLSWRPLVVIGLVSYSAYLWHVPLFVFAGQISPGPDAWPVKIALVVAALGFGWASWRWIEAPFRDRRHLSRRTVAALAIGASLAFAGLGALGQFTRGFEARMTPRQQAILAGIDDINPRRAECLADGPDPTDLATRCVIGDRANVAVALVGDSHADAIVGALEPALARAGLGARNYTRVSCPPSIEIDRIDRSSFHPCHAFATAVESRILTDPSIRSVVLVARWMMLVEPVFDNREGFVDRENGDMRLQIGPLGQARSLPPSEQRRAVMDSYLATIRRYLAAGKQVVLVYPVPEVGWSVPETWARRMRIAGDESQPAPTTSAAVFRQRQAPILAAFDSLGPLPGLVRVRPGDELCGPGPSDRCITEREGRPLYADDDHLSTFGAAPVANAITNALLDQPRGATTESK